MKILITGGDGFIARNLFEQLEGLYTIVSLNSSELNLLDSAMVFDCIRKDCFDVIIHTATYDAAPKHSIKDPTRVMEYNLRMFSNIARCKDYFGKMIYYGSGAEFGRGNWIPKMAEDYFDKYVPTDQYGFSKYLMNKYVQLSDNIYNLRLFGVFGKYDDWLTRFIPNACCRVIFGLPITISQNRSFDFLYIDDLVNITKWFIENRPLEKTYNVCTGKVFDLLTLAKKILAISGKDISIIIEDNSLGIEYSGDNTKLISEIGKYDFMDVDTSIKELYNWYLANRSSIDKNKFLIGK